MFTLVTLPDHDADMAASKKTFGAIYEPGCLTLHKIPTPMAVFEYVIWRMVWFANW
jgi:hypothetical protein